MNEEPPAPHEEEIPQEETALPAPPAKQPLPQSVIVMGCVSLVLLSVVIIISMAPKKTEAPATSTPALASMEAEIQLLKENNNRMRTGLGLPPAESAHQESAEAIAARINQDAATLTALATKASEMIGDRETQLTERTRALNEALQAQKLLSDQIAAQRQELNGIKSHNDDIAALQAQLQASRQKVSELTSQVESLRDAPVILQQQLAEANRLKDEFQRQVKELQVKLAKANIFAGSEADIVQDAQVLYRSLLSLEGQAETEIARAYETYAGVGTTPLTKVAFATGSAELSDDDLAKLSAQVTEAPENALFFVVGYASKTGNADDNRKLSSARATAVANALADLKKPAQRVQAAYLGQTDRFGATNPEANQICELWQIVPKN